MALNFSESKRIPITEYLATLGFTPAKVRGNDYWYQSPFRGEKDPSFKVNTRLNLWYDHGSGEGGTILDLGARINSCSISEFAERLNTLNLSSTSFSFHRKPENDADPKLLINKLYHLTDPALIDYLKARGISIELASNHCVEAQFSIGEKTFKAIGFQNQSGGFELRNSWFKGSSSPKDISYFNSDQGRLCVLEGFIDFLSLKQLGKDVFPTVENSDFLVLNSLSLLSKNLEPLKEHSEVYLFLDNDQAGFKAKSQLESAGIRFKDQSNSYQKFKDLNEFLIESRLTSGRRHVLKF